MHARVHAHEIGHDPVGLQKNLGSIKLQRQSGYTLFFIYIRIYFKNKPEVEILKRI